ncbi:MAG: hypothetical protein Q9Q40_00025 [Acidobacteriota bacterium]|nr:hypothetical protein [Acidobacteriota bacterium]MDQ7088427.1 hypothetical protein [Acidobacteriota bacterium]
MKRWPLIPMLLLGALIPPLAGAATVSTDLYLADAELRVDRAGRVVLLIDRVDRGEPGQVDMALVYEPQQPLPPMAPRRWKDVAIEDTRTLHGRSMQIASATAPPVRLRLEVAAQRGTVTERRRIDEQIIDLRGGVALLEVGGRLLRDRGGELEPPPGFAEAETAHLVTSRGLPGSAPQAVGGSCGSGASSCSVNCRGNILGLSIGDDCAIQCKKGFSACCECTGWLGEHASCTCTLDQSAGDELSPEIGGGDEGSR